MVCTSLLALSNKLPVFRFFVFALLHENAVIILEL
jgi:hypothetical protein